MEGRYAPECCEGDRASGSVRSSARAAKPRACLPVGGFIAEYADLIEICRARAELLDLTRLETDRLAGLADGHAGHLLSRTFSKVFGPVTLLPVLQTLGLRMLLVEDPELTAHTLRCREPRMRLHVRRPRQLAPRAG